MRAQNPRRRSSVTWAVCTRWLATSTLARQLLATSNAAYADLGLTLNAATSQNEAVVELLAGNPAAAEESLRKGYRALEEMGERMFLPTTAAFLARAVLEQGRDEEAEDLAKLSAQLAAKGDLLSQILWRGVRARVFARRAQFEEAEALAREAVALAQRTDFVNHRADALLDLSQVLKASRRVDEVRHFRLRGAASIPAQGKPRLRIEDPVVVGG